MHYSEPKIFCGMHKYIECKIETIHIIHTNLLRVRDQSTFNINICFVACKSKVWKLERLCVYTLIVCTPFTNRPLHNRYLHIIL